MQIVYESREQFAGNRCAGVEVASEDAKAVEDGTTTRVAVSVVVIGEVVLSAAAVARSLTLSLP